MARILNVSEAASLALHACLALSSDTGRLMSARAIAEMFEVSEAHLAKVMQRLTRTGLVRSVRGARGGFTLAGAPDRITLLEIYEAIEGPLSEETCLFTRPVCDGTTCIFGSLLGSVHQQVRKHLEGTTLADLEKWKVAARRKRRRKKPRP